jgi:branched-chain amino acid transport system substrate-binding protein
MRTRQGLFSTVAGALILGTTAVGGGAQAQTVYNVAGLADFTGPYADIMKDLTGCRKAVLDWWNDEVGKAQGVALRIKEYDTRYDVAQVASLWPGIKSELNPVVALGVGGPDAAALQQRLPNDKVPLVLPTAGYGFAWKEGSWVFNTRPTYAHEAAAFYTWLQKKSGGAGPIKLGLISSEVSPAYVDIHKGVEKFAKDNPQVVEVVETIYTDAQPTDLTQQVNRLLRKGATVLQVFNNTASVVATRRALQSLGRPEVPIVMSAHNGLLSSGKALGDLKQLEGSYEVYGMAMPTADATPARAFFDKLTRQYKLQANYNSACIMGLGQAVVAVRAVEQAVKDKGAAGVTGADVRAAVVSAPLTAERAFGVLPGIRYGNEAPFPTQGLAANIGAVQNGQYRLLEQNVPVPKLTKW